MSIQYRKDSLNKLANLFRYIANYSGYIRITNETQDVKGNNNIIRCRCEEESIIEELSRKVGIVQNALRLDNCGGVKLTQRMTDGEYLLSIKIPLDALIFSDAATTNAFTLLEQNSEDFIY